MHVHYLKDKPRIALSAWQLVEHLQEIYPYLEFGWDGFIHVVIYRTENT